MKGVIYLDIETAPKVQFYADADDYTKEYFEKKFSESNLTEKMTVAEFYEKKVSLYAEFSKIVCLVLATHIADNTFKFKVLYSDKDNAVFSETTLLTAFAEILKKSSGVLCGHNIKGFDIPFLCKRFLANGLEVPSALNPYGKKQWDINHIDTMEAAKFGNFQGATTLDNLCHLLGIKSPKGDMDGSMVSQVYHNSGEDGLNKIANYCVKDVEAAVLVADRLVGGNKLNNKIKITF
jgi:predicted PolB exonuclease-like 3'-5' exonuclease